MRYRIPLLILPLLILLSACNLGATEPTEVIPPTPINNPSTAGKPVVTIVSPANGTEVVVGETVFINASVTNATGITSVQLFANGSVSKVIPFSTDADAATRSVLLDYTPQSQGTANLQVVVYRGDVISDPAEIQLNVRSSQALVTATSAPSDNIPYIDPNDPTCRALINTGLNFRKGPTTNYDVITVLAAGTVYPIIGRLGDNSWWQLLVGSNQGWVSAPFTTVYGICTAVPVVAPPPSPTPQGQQPSATPTPTLTLTPTPTMTLTPTVTTTPGTPDLVVTQMSGTQSLAIPSGQTSVSSTYSVNVTNTGSGPSGQFAVKLTVTAPGGGTTDYDLGAVSNLDAGEAIVLNINLTFDTAGHYTLSATADSNNQVTEISEVNNSALLAVDVTN